MEQNGHILLASLYSCLKLCLSVKSRTRSQAIWSNNGSRQTTKSVLFLNIFNRTVFCCHTRSKVSQMKRNGSLMERVCRNVVYDNENGCAKYCVAIKASVAFNIRRRCLTKLSKLLRSSKPQGDIVD